MLKLYNKYIMENVVRIDSAKIDEIWKNHIKNLDELNPEDRIIIGRGYCIEEELPKDGILFLGMNPSYPKETKDRTYIDKEKDYTIWFSIKYF